MRFRLWVEGYATGDHEAQVESEVVCADLPEKLLWKIFRHHLKRLFAHYLGNAIGVPTTTISKFDTQAKLSHVDMGEFIGKRSKPIFCFEEGLTSLVKLITST